MRFLLGLSAAAILAACGGASSSELFGTEPRSVIEEPTGTEPLPEDPADDPVAPPPAAPPAPAAPAKPDAGAVVDASVPPVACSFDDDCKDDELCNWRTDTCVAPGPIGAPCKRDLECQDDLCNWKLTKCSEPGPTGTPCRRNKECLSGTCTTSSTCK